ncbi:hypothetical protein D9M72_522530 [compost metagenome]
MATEIIPEDFYKGHTVKTLLGAALAALQEEEDRQDMARSVASAGRCLCGEENIAPGHVFGAIEEMLESTVCTNSVRRYVTELARRAGLEPASGARHG